MSGKIPLLVHNNLSEAHLARLADIYDVTYAPSAAECDAAIAANGSSSSAGIASIWAAVTPSTPMVSTARNREPFAAMAASHSAALGA